MSKPIRVIVADDHPIVRKGVVQLIAEDEMLEVVAETGDGRETLAAVDREEIDVAVLDLDMPGIGGLDVATRLLERDPPIPVLLLTMHGDEDLFNEAIDRGVSAYLLKEEAIDSIVDGIKCALRGEFYISPSLSNYVFQRKRDLKMFEEEHPGLGALTSAERTILKMVAEYKSSKEIAAELSVSPHTINTHRRNISAKLGLSREHPLLKFALANKFAIQNLSKED